MQAAFSFSSPFQRRSLPILYPHPRRAADRLVMCLVCFMSVLFIVTMADRQGNINHAQ